MYKHIHVGDGHSVDITGVLVGLMMNAYAVEMSPTRFTVLIREYLVCNLQCISCIYRYQLLDRSCTYIGLVYVYSTLSALFKVAVNHLVEAIQLHIFLALHD